MENQIKLSLEENLNADSVDVALNIASQMGWWIDEDGTINYPEEDAEMVEFIFGRFM